MNIFNASKVDDKEIRLRTVEELKKLYEQITKDEEDFILTCGGQSKVMLANKLLGKIKSGELVLSSDTGGN